ncbi:MAG: hypothetical protein D6719_04575 [Candidatus Dadabacteria bacterium]|nr:MAG: hypothetical protein D6719_04575 [Candidatus Dadabacteria bacterium]
MEYRRLGKSGLPISEFSLGSWLTFGKQIGDTTAEDLMKTAAKAAVHMCKLQKAGWKYVFA